jgi:hypothetical protein
MAERTIATVLKTVEVQASGGSNPPPSADQTGRGGRLCYASRHATPVVVLDRSTQLLAGVAVAR